eukprot:gene19362-26010_t
MLQGYERNAKSAVSAAERMLHDALEELEKQQQGPEDEAQLPASCSAAVRDQFTYARECCDTFQLGISDGVPRMGKYVEKRFEQISERWVISCF